MGIVVDRFLQSEIESVGGSPAPDGRDPVIRDALLGWIDVLRFRKSETQLSGHSHCVV